MRVCTDGWLGLDGYVNTITSSSFYKLQWAHGPGSGCFLCECWVLTCWRGTAHRSRLPCICFDHVFHVLMQISRGYEESALQTICVTLKYFKNIILSYTMPWCGYAAYRMCQNCLACNVMMLVALVQNPSYVQSWHFNLPVTCYIPFFAHFWF